MARSHILIGMLLLLPRTSAGLPWTRVEAVPVTDVTCVERHGTTLYAGTWTTVYIGANEGTNWTATTPVNPSATGIQSIVPAGGALWAGTYGQGVYRSIDAGESWQPVSTGLDGLGAPFIIEMVEKRDSLYAGTVGAGVYVLDLAAPTHWSAFNAGFPVDISGNVSALVLHGTTLIAPAGGNGFVYRFPEGASAWQETAIVPPIFPGLLATDLVVSGADLLVGTTTNLVYRSSDDGQTWTHTSNGLARGTAVFLATTGPVSFAGIDSLGNIHRVYRTADRGDTWKRIDEIGGAFLHALEVGGDQLFAARSDGLWSTPLATTSVESQSWGNIKNRYRTGSVR